MTFQEIQEKLKKCELALTSIKDGSYSNTKYTREEALEKFNTIKESLEKKLNLLKEEETMFVSTKGGDTKAVSMDTKAAMDLKKDPNITSITTAKGKDLKEDDLSDEEQEEITTETSHTEVVAKEVHKAFIDALQETGHEVSEHSISSLNPETFTLTVKFKNNTQSDYSFELDDNEVKLDGNILVTTNKKGVTPVLNKTIAKDNSIKYLQNLSEKKGKDHDGDGDIDSVDYMIAKDKAIKANMKEDESEPVVDKKGKYTGVRRLKLSDKDKDTLKKIEDLLAKEKSLNEKMTYKDRKLSHEEVDRLDLIAHKEFDGKDFSQLSDEDKEKVFAKRDKVGVKETKGAPKGHYFTKSGNLVKGRLTKDARERGARLSDPKDKQRSKVPPVTQYNEGEGENHERIVVPRSQLKDALEIIRDNIDGNDVKVTSGSNISGKGIIKFHFNPSYSNVQSFMYDTVMDLVAKDINVQNSTKYIDEALDHNDPVLMRSRVAKMRADDMKKLDALKKANVGPSRKEIQARALVQKLKAKRAEIEREMENDPDIEPTGGPVADMYGDQLNKIDNAIEKAASVYNKPMDYDTAVGKVSEDMDVGHVDDEPGMLKQDAYEIAQYSIQLFKLLKHYESLDVEVDFPNWWQRKVMLARDYISKATHYLDFKTNEPAIDSQAAALQEDEEPTKADMAKEKSLAKKSALLQFIASMQKKGILDKDKKVLDKDAYKKELDAFKKNVKEGRNLNEELSDDQRDALEELENILNQAGDLGSQARDIIAQSFPNYLSQGDAYGAFNFGDSSNRYDTTLSSIVQSIYDGDEDMDEGKYKSDAQRKAIYATKAEKGELKEGDGLKEFEKEYLDTQFGDSFADDYPNTKKYSIESLYAAFEELHKKKGLDYEEFFELVDNGKIKRHSASKLLKPKAEKGELNEYTDDTFGGAELIKDVSKDSPDMFGKQLFADLMPKGVASEDEAVKALHTHDKSRIKQRMGGRLAPMFVHVQYHDLEHEGDKYRLHNRQYYNSNFKDKDPDFNPAVSKITLIKVIKSVDAKRGHDKTENLGSILVKTDAYVQDVRDLESQGKLGDRHMEEVLKEEATCCGRCGRVHVKGSGCKRPYLKGKSHCRNK